MATSPALLAECPCGTCIAGKKGMAVGYGGWEMSRSGNEAPKALESSLVESTPKAYRELLLQYKTANINVKNF